MQSSRNNFIKTVIILIYFAYYQISTVNIVNQHVEVQMNMSLSWQDTRLTFQNLAEDFTLNMLPNLQEEHSIWLPSLQVVKNKKNEIIDNKCVKQIRFSILIFNISLQRNY